MRSDMDSREDQLRDLKAELQRVHGGGTHIELAHAESDVWPTAEVEHVIRILRTLPDGAGGAAIASALGLSEHDQWQRGS